MMIAQIQATLNFNVIPIALVFKNAQCQSKTLEDMIVEVKEEKAVQVVPNNIANYVVKRRILMEQQPKIV